MRLKTWKRVVAPVLASLALLMVGCGVPAATTTSRPVDPFTKTWSLGDTGRSVSVSGNSAGHIPGGRAEFLLRLGNTSANESWQDEYCVLLVNTDGMLVEVVHEEFEVPVGSEIQKPVTVVFPKDIEGPLGLTVLIPLRGSAVTTVWVGEKTQASAGPWPTVNTCPRYLTEEGSRELAEKFVRKSPTFVFDGIEGTLKLAETLYPQIENAWQFVFQFESAHPGYGDRTGQMLAEVITPHEAVITVERGEVRSAVMDERWDMIWQRMLDETDTLLAPVHDVDVVFMESFPIQVGVNIRIGLRSGCTTFHDAVVARAGDTITIEVTVQEPKDTFCPAVYTYFEKSLNLGSDFEVGKIYTLNVNQYTTTFMMP